MQSINISEVILMENQPNQSYQMLAISDLFIPKSNTAETLPEFELPDWLEEYDESMPVDEATSTAEQRWLDERDYYQA
ncbi:hypothetical protein NG796_16915 [Laspinema sp. A4]|uniref:hypothetical protein n=1 Tax=Laspinema sp. D2d TaxID=2953686 RepID=UPI0021BA4BEA|nr:hypothetical protein [Laspinema sp. D2d]MCT7984955.1 hypothetical protein [Laspinema sp. D2d]